MKNLLAYLVSVAVLLTGCNEQRGDIDEPTKQEVVSTTRQSSQEVLILPSWLVSATRLPTVSATSSSQVPNSQALYFNYFIREAGNYITSDGFIDYNQLNAVLADAFNDGNPIIMESDIKSMSRLREVAEANNQPWDKTTQNYANQLVRQARLGYEKYINHDFSSYDLPGGPLPATNENILKGLPVTR